MIVAASVQEEINGIINVCTGKPMSLADRVEQFLRDKNYKIKLDYGAFPDRPYDSPGTWGDPTKNQPHSGKRYLQACITYKKEKRNETIGHLFLLRKKRRRG